MNSKKDRISARQISRSVSREIRRVPRVSDSLRVLEDSCDEGSFESFDATHYALQTLNKHIERRLAKLQANTIRLKRELWLLQRHIKEFRHPLFENWEADMLTRLIEVAHAHQHKKLPGGVVIGEFSFAERENLNHAYSIAAKAIRMPTLRKLGLSEKYHQALQRYSEVAPYRSPNPFQTEFAFAKWLIEVRDDRPELYGFWSKLFPVCYDRSVQESASIF